MVSRIKINPPMVRLRRFDDVNKGEDDILLLQSSRDIEFHLEDSTLKIARDRWSYLQTRGNLALGIGTFLMRKFFERINE